MSAIGEEIGASMEEGQNNEDIFRELEKYPWDTDQEFQGGLQAILGSSTDPDQIQQLTLRARTFFYARKFSTQIDFDAYKTWRAAHPSLPPLISPKAKADVKDVEPNQSASDGEPPTPYPQTFQDIVRLITSGEPIPGIKEIPPTVLENKASKAVVSKRRKPWEKEVAEVNQEEGTFGDRRDEYIVQETV